MLEVVFKIKIKIHIDLIKKEVIEIKMMIVVIILLFLIGKIVQELIMKKSVKEIY